MFLAYRGSTTNFVSGGLRGIDLQNGQSETLLDYPVLDMTLSADQSIIGLSPYDGQRAGNLLSRQFHDFHSPKGMGVIIGGWNFSRWQFVFFRAMRMDCTYGM